MDTSFLTLSHFPPDEFSCHSHLGRKLLELGTFTGGSCFCSMGGESVRNVHSCGVCPGGSLNSSLLGPHSFLASCCPGFGWHNCLFIMLLLPGRDKKAVIWNSGSYFLWRRIIFQRRKDSKCAVKSTSGHCMARICASI